MAFFKPASRKKVRGRIAFDGPAGSGKTFTALRLAHALGRKIAVINTESGAVEKYLGLNPDGIPWQFDVGYLQDNSPTSYTAAILEAARAGYEVLIVDSLSHAWVGSGGALELVDKKGGAKFSSGWRDVTPMHNRMIEAILGSPCHLIATLRTKTEYVVEEYIDNNGHKKSAPRRVGMAPIQRAGMEYEFDLVADMDLTNTLTVGKTRCPAMRGQVSVMPGADFFAPLVEWLNEGSEVDPSFYIANEADLERSERARKEREAESKRIERQQEAAAKAAEKEASPKVDAKELIRQKAAERKAAEEAAAANTEAVESTPGDNGEGVADAAGSEGSNAGTITAEAPSDPPFDATDNGTPEPNSSTGPAEGPCTDIQVEQIKTMLGEIQKTDAKIGDKVKNALASQGFSKISELSRAGAEELLRKLYQKAAGERLSEPAKN